ncbi:MAG: hypothetical protein CFH01_01788 [Alphaproteobacteria bacterium MarineAlpha2_Bin1]|nr:MAG: hypothetical protein CFH01_01788 [Alphaproteobacteria bacterium MarineAlpha2_Bin1]|tara:strand:- start:169 stop:1032 length:864 start_codon:yes stop_codon:yes gene_type:complete
MPRETVNFICSSWFEWKPNNSLNNLPGAMFKILNENKTSGEITLLFKLSKNSLYKKSILSKFNEEIYVLDGSLKFSGTVLKKDFYTYLPIGYKKKLFSSSRGSIGIIFLNKRLVSQKKINKFYPNFDHKSWIPRINAYENIWPSASDHLKSTDINNLGARVKILREDKSNNSTTFLLGFPPLWSLPETVNLGGDIEIFLIYGNVNSSRGLMNPGSYLSIPKGKVLSHMYSKEASVFLIKSHRSIDLNIRKSNINFNYKDIIKTNNSIIPKKILKNIKFGPYSRFDNV